MDSDTIDHLIGINRRFYQQFAVAFDRTRVRLQPGVERLVGRIAAGARVLDLGCGNGGLWRALKVDGFAGTYSGLDFSPALVQIAAVQAGGETGVQFQVRDLAADGWEAGLEGPFDRILAFAVLHHLPPILAEGVLKRCCSLVAPDGFLALSTWQFLSSPRWRLRIQPWERAGVDPGAVGEDDHLLDWRSGGTGLRYVHHYDAEALHELAGRSGFTVVETTRSDGREGDLGLYQTWEPADG
ncbi:MAG TPA: class I SAM-dependent methyltransferase [Anaerolineales bacterium]|nr:class I SAM-dependent methyltransferase [Anaerolineales bacterium]